MIIVLTGPTGSGKTDVAIELAKSLGGAIINADAFQVYQELSIATAKPTPEQMRQVPHYLFDFLPLTKDYDVYAYQRDFREKVKELEAFYPYLIVAGGTGLYIRSALYDYDFSSSSHLDLSKYDSFDNESLHKELEKIDPESAAKIHPNNRRRVLRAIEIYLINGKNKTEVEALQTHKPIYDCLFFGLSKERDDIYASCDARVEKMFEMGLIEENKRLFDKYGTSPRAFQAIGVKQTIPYFEGKITLEEAKERIKIDTRHYIKRQMTFFQHQFDLCWVENSKDILSKIPAK